MNTYPRQPADPKPLSTSSPLIRMYTPAPSFPNTLHSVVLSYRLHTAVSTTHRFTTDKNNK